MKPHLPLSLLHAVMCAVCSFTFATTTLAGGVMALTAPYAQAASFDESNHHVEYTKDTVYGGIILSELGAEMTLEGLSSVRLSNNEIVSSRKVYGGVICNYKMGSGAGPVLTMSNNGNITFSGNTVSISAKNVNAYGGVLYNGTSYANTESHASICGNGVVSFTDNAMVLYDGGYGGAIYNLTGTHKLQLNDNEALIFSSNSIRAQGASGGAIYSAGEAEIIGNGALKFLNNGIDGRVTASYVGDAKGGAIYIDNNGTKDSSSGNTFTYGLTIAKTASVEFSGNYLISSNSHTNIYGGAICADASELRVVNNGDIVFNGNSITGTGFYLLGGAVYSKWAGESIFTANGNISFSKNSISSLDGADYTYGGAIYHENNMTMSGNKTISFVENFVEGLNSVKGGAVYAGTTHTNSELFAINDNQGDIIFNGNSAKSTANKAYGGAVNSTGPMSLSGNYKIQVTNNKAFGSLGAFGGAFYIDEDFACDHNSSVLFSGNTATAETGAAQGGALYVHILDDLHFLDNSGKLTFSGNKVISEGANAEGGAIYSYGDGSPIFSVRLNDGISFTDNKAISNTKTASGGAIYSERRWVYSFTGTGNAEFYRNSTEGDKALGGAVYIHNSSGGSGSLSMDLSGNIIFSENKATSQAGTSAGALRTDGDVVLILKGANIIFSDNIASADSGDAQGGAQSSYGSVDMQATNAISYTGNTAVSKAGSAWGGAAVMDNNIHQNPGNLTAGERILFSDNHAIGSQKAQGGALYVRQELTLGETKNITFSDNTAECGSGEAWGGAIHMRWVYPFALNLTENVLFENNAVLVESGNAYGGAISVDNASTGSAGFHLCDNGVVNFIGNHADSQTGNAFGGAIYAQKRVDIVGNSNVTFRKNYVKQGTTYKLSDLYSTLAPNLAAAEGGEIRFNGAVEVLKDVVLNQDYTGADSQTHAATGSIVFSGKYTEADLKEIKGGIAGTADEIRNSRTSSINGMLTLNNGRLLVEDHALLTATRMTAKAGTTVAIDNASLVSSSTSTSASTNTLTDCALVLTNGGALTFGGGLTLSGKVTLDVSGYAAGTYTLLSAYSVKGADLLDISYNAGKYDIYDIAWNEKQNALLLTVTKLGRTEPENHIWSEPSGVLGNDLPLGESGEDFLPGDSLQFNTATTVDIRGEVKPADIVVKNTSGTVELSTTENGSISGSTSLSKSGAGSLTVNTANTYSGGTAISGGTVTAGNAAAFGSGEITLTGGTLAMGTQAVANDVTATGGTLTGTAYKGDLTVKGNVTIGSGFKAGSLDLESGTLKGSVKTGDVHTLYADGGQISGSLTLNGGSIVFGDSPLAVSGALTISSSTALDLSSYSGAGQYTLISAGSVSGNLSNLSYDSTVGRNSYSVIKSGNALVLNVESHAVTLTWDAPKGVWTTGGAFGSGVFESGDDVIFRTAAAVTITGAVEPGEMLVDSSAAVKFTANTKTPGSGIVGKGTLTKSGAGMLTLNAGNRYSGGTVLNAGTIKATAADSFGTGAITVHGGTLDLASKAVANNIVLAGSATLKGDAKYVGSISVDGNATLLAKSANKSLITIGSGNTLNLAPAATVAGSLDVGGTLNITAVKGLTVTKGNTLTLNGGTVNGLVNVAAGAALALNGGTLTTAPVLTGGKLVMPDAKGDILLSGTGTLALDTQNVGLKGKGELVTDAPLAVTGGKVTLTALNSYANALEVAGGTLALGKVAVAADVNVSGSAALNNGTAHSGNVNVSGELIKGSVIKLTQAGQEVNLNHSGVMNGTISGLGMVNVNADVDASLGKMTNAAVNLNSGTLTNSKGLKLAKGQTLTFSGGNLNLSGKLLTSAAGTTLHVEKSGTVSGSLTMAGGALVLEDGVNFSVSGALTLSKATALTLDGTATLTFGTLTAPKKGTLEEFFGVDKGITITQKGNTLTFSGYSVAAAAAPAAVEPETVAAPAPAIAPAVAALAAEAAAARPLGDALVMADWGIVDANRAFTGTLQSRRDSGVLLADGQGMAWVSAMGGVSRHGSENGHNGADVNLSGAAVGVEHTAGANSVLGLAVGHTWSRIGATGMQHLRQDTAHVALYGSTKLPHGFSAEWTAAYGDTDSKGSFNGTRETWSQKSTALSARLNKTHELTDSTAVRGFAGLSYDATDAASIHGMHTGSIRRLQGGVGAGITHRADKLTTYAEASVTTDLARNTPAVDFGAWRQNGATPGRTGLNLTLGAAYELTDKWSINAAYHVEAAERATQHTLNIGAGRKF